MKLVPRDDVWAAAGRLTVCGVHGTTVDAETKEVLREVKPAGVILFGRNVESAEQLLEYVRELADLRRGGEPLIVTVDQEGGQVAQLRAAVSDWGTMRQLGAIGDAKLAERVGAAVGHELRALGIDVNWAPVLDVDTNADNPIIGDRSLSADPERVAELGAALVRGLQGAGVAACGKHFPGHGDTDVDSHLALPMLDPDPEQLRHVEWPPFAAAIEAGVSAIMTAHVVVACLDPERPATVSRPALAPLREELGFEGLIVSDGIEMKGLADHFTPHEIATDGIHAGVGLFLACDPETALEHHRALIQSVEQEAISHETLLAASRRVEAWRRRWWRGPGTLEALRQWVRCGEHQALLEEVASRAADVGA